MEKREFVSFRTNSKLEKLIGRELITNNTIAVFELIKNSYDAGAKKVDIIFNNFLNYSIVEKKDRKQYYINGQVVMPDTVVSRKNSSIAVVDNGKGMSLNEVKNYWMEIGTVHKELVKQIQVEADAVNRMYTRILNGEKGIGRFGTDKIGARLILDSIDKQGTERTVLTINWGDFDDHSKTIQDVKMECQSEHLNKKQASGVKLEMQQLRDEWTIKDIEDLKRQLKKFISPFSQEIDLFSIYVHTGLFTERIVNDAFDYSNTSIEATIDNQGVFKYIIQDNIDETRKVIKRSPPSYGSVKLKILYMDRAAKNSFTRRTGVSTRGYGNIKLFRDNFRILPYGEPDDDWLRIDNEHAQAVFRSLGTRDIIGYVQISNIGNETLKDATSRLGLVEDSDEFKEFKGFIWDCIHLLEDYIFKRIKAESEKQGEIIEQKVIDVKFNTERFKKELYDVITNTNIPNKDASNILKLIDHNVANLKRDIKTVEDANKELSKRMKVFERIMGTEGLLYDILHVVKNKISIIDAQIFDLTNKAESAGIEFDSEIVTKSLRTIRGLVSAALRKASATKIKKESHILSDLILESIKENRLFASDKGVKIRYDFKDNYQRVYCNKESIKIVFDNLFNNSFKVLKDSEVKEIYITTERVNKNIEIMFMDSGPGILDDVAPFIFSVGYSRTNGSGLGLPASLDIMQDHGGDISFVKLNDSVLAGACFILKLPIHWGL